MRILNIIIIILTATVIWVISSVFFLGSQEQYLELKKKLPNTFFVKAGTMSAFGVIVIGLFTIINFILNRTFCKSQPEDLKYFMLYGILTVAFASLIGANSFFYLN